MCRRQRHNHKLLNINRIVGMRAAIQNIHHRHRQNMRRHAANIAPKRCVLRGGGGLGNRQRNAQHGIGPSRDLFSVPSSATQSQINMGLLGGVHTGQRRQNFAVHRIHRFLNTFAEIALLVAVAQFDGLIAPVEAPDGTPARPVLPSSRTTSTSMVGLPLLSRISRPIMSQIAVMNALRSA